MVYKVVSLIGFACADLICQCLPIYLCLPYTFQPRLARLVHTVKNFFLSAPVFFNVCTRPSCFDRIFLNASVENRWKCFCQIFTVFEYFFKFLNFQLSISDFECICNLVSLLSLLQTSVCFLATRSTAQNQPCLLCKVALMLLINTLRSE